jgi:hypothetical protein
MVARRAAGNECALRFTSDDGIDSPHAPPAASLATAAEFARDHRVRVESGTIKISRFKDPRQGGLRVAA